MAQASLTEAVVVSNVAQAPVPFAFESHQIRTVINGDGIPWFVARDTAAALGIGWSGHTLDNIPADWQRMVKLTTPRMKDGEIVANTKQKTKLISEPAVYKLAFRSNKSEADRFTNWIASEVIPALRRTGKYEICPDPTPVPTTITPSQQQELQNIVAAKASAFPKEALGRVRAQLWSRLHNKFKVAKYDQLPAAAFPEAVEYLVGLTVRGAYPEALPDAEPASAPLALPPVRHRKTLDDYRALYQGLPDSPQMWVALITRLTEAMRRYEQELEAIRDEATRPFRANRKSQAQTYFDAAMSPTYSLFNAARADIRSTYNLVYDALQGCRETWTLLDKG